MWRVTPPQRRTALFWIAGATLLVVAFCVGGLLVSAQDRGPQEAKPVIPVRPATSATSSAVTPSASAPPGALVLPLVVGLRLPDAELAMAGGGFNNLAITDATGKGRPVLEKVNWVVIAQEPIAATSVSPLSIITLRVRKPTDGAGDPQIQKGVVPLVVCMDLQTAQDALRSSGFYNLRSTDGTGQGRQQLLDRNWVVIGQSARAGTSPDLLTVIELTVVKFGESTGSSGCAS